MLNGGRSVIKQRTPIKRHEESAHSLDTWVGAIRVRARGESRSTELAQAAERDSSVTDLPRAARTHDHVPVHPVALGV